MVKMTHEQLVKKALRKPGVQKAYAELDEEFSLLDKMLQARKHAKKTQSDVARVMKIKTSNIGRLESVESNFNPTVTTLRAYAKAVGCKLIINFKPIRHPLHASSQRIAAKNSKRLKMHSQKNV